MIRIFAVGGLALALLGSSVALAAQPTPVPNAAPDFSSMSFQIGTWNCRQTIVGRPGTRMETDTYSLAYDGWQMQDHVVSPPFDKYRSRNVVGDNWTTWDPTIKLWINQTVNNFGAYGLSTSPGWVDNTMTWSQTNPDGTKATSVVTKVSDTQYKYRTIGNNKMGDPQAATGSGVCTKS